MIRTQRQYAITGARLEEMERGLREYEKRGGRDLEPGMRQLTIDSMRALCEEWREDLAAYDALRQWQGSREFTLHRFEELPDTLVRARIAAGLTQRQLAERLGLKPQQIQRYEATSYRGVAWDTAARIAGALGLQLEGTMRLG